MIISILVGLVAFTSVISLLSLGFGIYASIELKAMQRSTHSVQYVDPFVELMDDTKDIDKANQEFLKKEAKKMQEDADIYADIKAGH